MKYLPSRPCQCPLRRFSSRDRAAWRTLVGHVERNPVKSFLTLVGFLLLPVALYALSLVVRGYATNAAWGWMLGAIALVLAMWFSANEPRRARYLAGAGIALIAVVALSRWNLSRTAGSRGVVLLLPAGTPAPLSARIGQEADIAMMLFVAMGDTGGIADDDYARGKRFVRAAWRRMARDRDYDPVPSVLVPQLLGSSTPARIPTLILNPPSEGQRAPRALLVLHGVGGAQKLPCWMMARRMPDAMVVCPAVGLGGEWGEESGMAMFDEVLAYVTLRSNAVYVIGMNYGARGVLHLLARRHLGHVAGAVLISGIDENNFDAIRRSNIPLMIVRGNQDARTAPFRLEGVGGLNRIHHVNIDGGNLVFYEQEDAILAELDDFCGGH